MLTKTLTSAAILAVLISSSVQAQPADLATTPAAIVTTAPTTLPPAAAGDDEVTVALHMVSAWLNGVFGLPLPEALPEILRFSPHASAPVRLALAGPAIVVQPADRPAVASASVAYDDATRTVLVAQRWTGSTPAEMSALVHAMAQHMQAVGVGARFDCPEQRNALPYDAQARWLGLYGLNLADELAIDAGARMLLTQCLP